MKDGQGFPAALSCSLASLCVFWLVADVMILGRSGWDVGLFWLLLCTALSAGVFELFLKKARSLALISLVTAGLGLAWLGLFVLLSRSALSFRHVLVMLVGAGMAVGMPLHFCLKRPGIHQHLSYLDVSVLAFMVLLLCGEYLGIGKETNILFVLVLLLQAGSAVGLRMRSGGHGADLRRATLTALASAAVLALIVLALVSLFSRSGALTAGILAALAAAGQAVGGALSGFGRWLAELLYRPEEYELLPLEPTGPAVVVEGLQQKELVLPGWFTGLCLAAAAIAVLALLVLFLRHARRPAPMAAAAPGGKARESRVTGLWKARWQAFLRRLRFSWDALRFRDRPAGLLVWLERRAKKEKRPRQTEESMRAFVCRMAPGGELSALADALDMEYYRGTAPQMSPAACRNLRRDYRRRTAKGA